MENRGSPIFPTRILRLSFNTFLVALTSLVLALPASAGTRILALGDSLTEGYGIAAEEAYPAKLAHLLRQAGLKEVEVLNAGISGSTSASAVSRLKWHLRTKPYLLILALGANDGLRGKKVAELRKNLSDTIELAQKNGVRVILAGMQVPENMGRAYAREFAALFPELAAKYRLKLIPFLLEGVAGDPARNLPDKIHPNEKGHSIIADTVFRTLRPLL